MKFAILAIALCLAGCGESINERIDNESRGDRLTELEQRVKALEDAKHGAER